MADNQYLLVVERSSSELSYNNESGEYILEGIFGEIGVKNKNNRIYDESEYVPQIKALQEKIKGGKLLGELDHPSNFDISLRNASHDLRAAPLNPKFNVGPWLNSTIEPDYNIKPIM